MKIKRSIIIILFISIAALCVAIYFIKFSNNFNEGRIKDLIATEYNVIKVEEDSEIINIVISGMLSLDEIKELNENIYEIATDNSVKENEICIQYIEGTEVLDDDFYYEGLISKANINLEEKTIEVEHFEEVRAEPSQNIKEYTDQDLVGSKDGIITLALTMDLDNLSNEEILAQAKTYGDIFIRTNPDKKISGVQVNIYAETGNIYKYCSPKVGLLSIVEISDM
ncbi:hypothetical protein [Clostridium vincentii]|uniref:Uncharacterized protein n=1 Tax=Clostridium vincentii TaxID=52704 RepID=A0A2T0B7K8_9CLOT|nr:hypothetical protein [Clostridium vincentii]PRR79787.1 hypothetical protein CLVI_32330 [Clostridium vincentii]